MKLNESNRINFFFLEFINISQKLLNIGLHVSQILSMIFLQAKQFGGFRYVLLPLYTFHCASQQI